MNHEKLGTPVAVRLPESLSSQIRRQAAANRRSLNSEIIVCLEKAVASTTEGESNGTRA
ncbi:Arc family DNA-binding protein [Rhizobium sp. S-51]|uniref:Arc family DNA-binding protein n=1 Tax=Rhizobium terricola TaxID=2728849 RepID=A0A7Y0FUT3_9HYPH|nr:Arc family DNA-binding protein [Rhizobium terricola]NML73066.1 Arc family DNA-binding protein [Rhizobium terricola]